jgi:hypothetical protein
VAIEFRGGSRGGCPVSGGGTSAGHLFLGGAGGTQGWAGAVQEEGGAATGVQARGQGVEQETHGRLQGLGCWPGGARVQVAAVGGHRGMTTCGAGCAEVGRGQSTQGEGADCRGRVGRLEKRGVLVAHARE